MAMLVCQTSFDGTLNVWERRTTFPRISKKQMSEEIYVDVDVAYYKGPKKPTMLEIPVAEENNLQERAQVSVSRTGALDVQFLKSITSGKECEYNGHIAKVAREQHHTIRPATQSRYQPLINMKPADPSTIKTSMHEAKKLTTKCGQFFVVMMADLQIYKGMLDNLWASPDFYPRLGGMHMLMSFCGCVGKLMSDSGLTDILRAAFAGVAQMLLGKKYPHNVRALRLLTEELLRDIMQDN